MQSTIVELNDVARAAALRPEGVPKHRTPRRYNGSKIRYNGNRNGVEKRKVRSRCSSIADDNACAFLPKHSTFFRFGTSIAALLPAEEAKHA